jgi:hypothetical protein
MSRMRRARFAATVAPAIVAMIASNPVERGRTVLMTSSLGSPELPSKLEIKGAIGVPLWG